MDRPLDIFLNSKTQIFLNPKLESAQQDRLRNEAQKINLKSHVWLTSSGTESLLTGQTKMIALSHEAILAAAQGVTKEFQITNTDIYLDALPLFHIAGLSVWARAYVSQCQVLTLDNWSWSVDNFVKIVEEKSVTLSSLVPTQIYDLVQAKQKAPKSVRHIFVGGGALSPLIWSEAQILGWPLMLTYGMTETCAMVGVSASPDEGLRQLPHVDEWQVSAEGRLSFLSPALLTGYLFVPPKGESQFVDPKVDGWYLSDDRGKIINQRLHLEGRESEFVKINGESVSLASVQAQWDHFALQHQVLGPSYILALPHERHGFILGIVSNTLIKKEDILLFNKTVLPFERLHKLFKLQDIPLSPLGKLKRVEVLAQLAGAHPQWLLD